MYCTRTFFFLWKLLWAFFYDSSQQSLMQYAISPYNSRFESYQGFVMVYRHTNSNNWGRLLSSKVLHPTFGTRDSPHLFPCTATPPQIRWQHLSLRRWTTGFPPVWRIYGCRRFSRDSCRVQWVLLLARRLLSVSPFHRDSFFSEISTARYHRQDCRCLFLRAFLRALFFSLFLIVVEKTVLQIRGRTFDSPLKDNFAVITRTKIRSSLCGRIRTRWGHAILAFEKEILRICRISNAFPVNFRWNSNGKCCLRADPIAEMW